MGALVVALVRCPDDRNGLSAHYLQSRRRRGAQTAARCLSGDLLRLNQIVICGETERRGSSCARHFRETERRFYDDSSLGGIRALMNYLADHRHPTVWRRAAAVYAQVLSEPQLFFEGNHRTGALLMSHVLLRGGQPPLVLTQHNAKAYFDPSSLVKGYRKRSLQTLFEIPGLVRRLAELLEKTSDRRYLADRSQGTK